MKKRCFFHNTIVSSPILFVLLFFIPAIAFSQFNLTIRIKEQPLMHTAYKLYVAGNFNGWDAADKKFILTNQSGPHTITISNLAAGHYEFKITRGSWDNVEVQSDGAGIGNRTVQLSSDTTIELNIQGWQDYFTKPEKQHTTSPRVSIMDTAFYIPQLDKKRRVWIYLPEGYTTTGQRYPVLYMHDGQNVFDAYTAAFDEWGVDECLDSLVKKGKPACIVVAIDNGPERINEYLPFDHEQYGKAKGSQYVDFLAHTLKPFIDAHYRTLPAKEQTIIAGSSLGGLISYYAMLKHPDVFGKAGVFSPSFWIAPGIKELTDLAAPGLTGKLFFYMGELEGDADLQLMHVVTEKLGAHSRTKIYSVTDPVSEHNEKAWRKWFNEFYSWIIADGFNSVIRIRE